MARLFDQLRCDCCGQFLNPSRPGTSWSQSWGYEMDGCPTLYDPQFRCAPCTERHGIRDTNCAHPERYQGMMQVAP